MGVVKSIIAEITDETNVARAFSLLPMTWAVGVVIGLAIFCLPSPVLANISVAMSQPVSWWRLISTSRSLAYRLLTPFLGQISLLPTMSSVCSLCMCISNHSSEFLGGGWFRSLSTTFHFDMRCRQSRSGKKQVTLPISI